MSYADRQQRIEFMRSEIAKVEAEAHRKLMANDDPGLVKHWRDAHVAMWERRLREMGAEA